MARGRCVSDAIVVEPIERLIRDRSKVVRAVTSWVMLHG